MPNISNNGQSLTSFKMMRCVILLCFALLNARAEDGSQQDYPETHTEEPEEPVTSDYVPNLATSFSHHWGTTGGAGPNNEPGEKSFKAKPLSTIEQNPPTSFFHHWGTTGGAGPNNEPMDSRSVFSSVLPSDPRLLFRHWGTTGGAGPNNEPSEETLKAIPTSFSHHWGTTGGAGPNNEPMNSVSVVSSVLTPDSPMFFHHWGTTGGAGPNNEPGNFKYVLSNLAPQPKFHSWEPKSVNRADLQSIGYSGEPAAQVVWSHHWGTTGGAGPNNEPGYFKLIPRSPSASNIGARSLYHHWSTTGGAGPNNEPSGIAYIQVPTVEVKDTSRAIQDLGRNTLYPFPNSQLFHHWGTTGGAGPNNQPEIKVTVYEPYEVISVQ